MSLVLKTAQDDSGRRLDRVLRKSLGRISPGLPLSAIHRLLRKNRIFVDGTPCGPEFRVMAGQTIEIRGLEAAVSAEFKGPEGRKPQGERPVPLDILYEGNGLLILNKAAGTLAHGEGSLEERISQYLEGKLPPSLSFRPGPLHRLDKPSSGAIVFSTNIEGARYFSALLRERQVCKRYLAIVDGIIKNEGLWDDLLIRDTLSGKTFLEGEREPAAVKPANGEQKFSVEKKAVSLVRPLKSACGGNLGWSLILVEIKTGRTHQIRAQAAARGHPLSGDKKYGGQILPGKQKGFFLHAWTLDFRSPQGKTISVKAPVPEAFAKTALELFGKDALPL